MTESPLGHNQTMETANERRRRKLQWAVDNLGGIEPVARAADLNPRTLHQILVGTLLPPKSDGSRSPRSLGDASARAIEDAFPELGRGWFDAAEPVSGAYEGVYTVGAFHPQLAPALSSNRFSGVEDVGRVLSMLDLGTRRAVAVLLEAAADTPEQSARLARQIQALIAASAPEA